MFTQKYQGKKVWVTGGTGFKGAWLCEVLLKLGAEVSVFSLPPPSHPSLFEQLQLDSRIRWTEGDIRDGRSVENAISKSEPDFVFNLAAQPLVRQSYRDPVGTYETNVMGTIQILEGLRQLKKPCAALMVTSDKCYENREWLHGYREEDCLGGHDPYSSSKAACEIATASWRRSFFQNHPVKIASARSGNVVGGGDWAVDRIVPDCIRALSAGKPVQVRNPASTRPWQHVLEPLAGYLQLAVAMADESDPARPLCSAFNFGPNLDSNRSVRAVVEETIKSWSGSWVDLSPEDAPHEAGKLNLATEKAFHLLGWMPRWNFETTIRKTLEWYLASHGGADPGELTRRQIEEYFS